MNTQELDQAKKRIAKAEKINDEIQRTLQSITILEKSDYETRVRLPLFAFTDGHLTPATRALRDTICLQLLSAFKDHLITLRKLYRDL